MFNFTTQTVYNQIADTGANKNMWIATGGKKPAIRIGNTRFDAADIISVERKNPTPESLASVTFDMADIIPDEGEVSARIALYVQLSMNSQDSFYANDLVYKGKPFYIEFSAKAGEGADVVAKRVKNIADKYFLFVTQEKLLDVSTETTAASGDDPATGTVTFTGVNGYQQFKKAALQKYDEQAKTINCCEEQGDFVDVVVGVPVIYTIDSTTGKAKVGNPAKVYDGVTDGGRTLTANEVAIKPGIEAFGDYNWIIHNLRLPTAANTNFWAPTKEEMPVPGATYVQFIVKMGVEREGISGEIVGASVKSVTTHVLYVNKDYADDVADAFDDLGITIATTADTDLASPFA